MSLFIFIILHYIDSSYIIKTKNSFKSITPPVSVTTTATVTSNNPYTQTSLNQVSSNLQFNTENSQSIITENYSENYNSYDKFQSDQGGIHIDPFYSSNNLPMTVSADNLQLQPENNYLPPTDVSEVLYFILDILPSFFFKPKIILL